MTMRLRRALCASIILNVLSCGARDELDGAGSSEGGEAEGGAAQGAGGEGAGSAAGSPVGAGGHGGDGGQPAGGAPGISPIEACVIASSCDDLADGVPLTASACIDGYSRLGWLFERPGTLVDPHLAGRILKCAEGFSGCASFQECYGGDWIELGRCREGGYCDGNVMRSWQDGPTFDCSAIASGCTDLSSGAIRACCNPTPCGTHSGIACDGSVAMWCGGWGESVQFDCAPSGRACNAEGAQGAAPCIGDGEPCADDAPITCEGSVATYCSGGRSATFDCGTTAHRTKCALGEPSYYAPCVAPGGACDPESHFETCVGGAMMICVEGEETSVGCSELGFSACEDTDRGARCIP